MEELKHIAGLKVITDKAPASLIKLLLKYRRDSIAKIKDDIEKGRYVLFCSSVSEEEKFNLLIQCYDELIRDGYKVELYEDGQKSSIQLFRNWSKTLEEIRKEVEGTDIH